MAVAMAVQRSRRSGLACNLCWDAAHESGIEAQMNKTNRDDARGIAQMLRLLSSRACEDATQPGPAHAADRSQAAAAEGHRDRKRSTHHHAHEPARRSISARRAMVCILGRKSADPAEI